MSDDRPVRFQVVDETGMSVAGALLSVLRSTVAFPEISLVTDRDGRVQMSLPVGRFVIGANASGGRHAEVELDSGRTHLGEEIRVVLQSAP